MSATLGPKRSANGLFTVKSVNADHMKKPVMTSRSAAVQYEVRLQELITATGSAEKEKAKPNISRLSCHMKVLQEMLDGGVFGGLQSVMEQLTDELKLCLYSDQMTTAPEACGGEMECVPFFRELATSRVELVKLRIEHESVSSRLASIEAGRASRTASRVAMDNAHIADLQARVGELVYEVDKSKAEAALMRDERDRAKAEKDRDLLGMEGEVRHWKERADDTEREVRRLKQGKEQQEEVQQVFAHLQNVAREGVTDTAGKDLEAMRLEGQLLVLQNTRVDEYESALEGCMPSQVEELRTELVSDLSRLQEELSMLQRHLDRDRAAMPPKPKKTEEGGVPASEQEWSVKLVAVSATESGAVVTELEEKLPLVPGGGERHVAVPPGTTEVIVQRVDDPGSGSSRPPGPQLVEGEDLGAKPSSLPGAVEGADADRGGSGLYTGHPLWDGFLQRSGTTEPSLAEPKRPRKVWREALVKEIESVLRAKISAEVVGGDEGRAVVARSVHDFFYSFLENKYVLRPTVLLVAHGILLAVEDVQEQSSVVNLFCMVMAGECDDAIWRYTMHWRRLLDSMPCSTMAEFSDFLTTLYPSAREEEVSSMSMEFSAHCRGVPTPHAAVEFLTGRLVQKSELRLRKWLKILKWKDTHHRNSFRKPEFVEMAAKLFPGSTRADAAEAFDAAARPAGGERASIDALGHAASLLDAASIEPSRHGVEQAVRIKPRDGGGA